MARFIGADGVVSVGGTPVGEVRSFELNIEAPIAEAPSMGQTWAGHGVGAERATGTVTCWYDASDAQQTSMSVGAKLALLLQPEGAGSGLPQFSWTEVVITGEPRTVERDSWAEATFAWAANSATDRTPQV